MPATASALQYKSLISEALWKRLVARLIRDHKVSLAKAKQIIDGALGFLKLCGDYPQQKFVPSRQVDKGWHTFLMYTHEYAEFCDRVCGRFIHHSPNDKGNAPTGKRSTCTRPDKQRTCENPPTKPSRSDRQAAGEHTARDTVVFMKKHGVEFNPMLWARAHGNDCGDCCTYCDCDDD